MLVGVVVNIRVTRLRDLVETSSACRPVTLTFHCTSPRDLLRQTTIQVTHTFTQLTLPDGSDTHLFTNPPHPATLQNARHQDAVIGGSNRNHQPMTERECTDCPVPKYEPGNTVYSVVRHHDAGFVEQVNRVAKCYATETAPAGLSVTSHALLGLFKPRPLRACGIQTPSTIKRS